MPRLFLFLSFVLISAPAFSQSGSAPVSLLLSLPPALSRSQADPLGASLQPAALASLPAFTAALSSERRWLLAELSSYALASSFPAGPGRFGVDASFSGNPAYREWSAGGSYARRMERVDAGIRLHFRGVSVPGYGSRTAAGASAGLILQGTDALRAGLSFGNLAEAGWRVDKAERAPFSCSAGLGYDLSPDLFLGAGVLKTEGLPAELLVALSFRLEGRLYLRAALATARPVYCLGTGVRLGAWRVELTAALHPALGLTPGISFIYRKKEGS